MEGGESEGEIPEGTEREKKDKEEDSISQILGSPRKVPVTTKCVLDMEKESKKILIEINRTLVKKLKPHQVEGNIGILKFRALLDVFEDDVDQHNNTQNI